MRYVKLLSLAAVAAVAAVALVGTGSASAWGFCKSAELNEEGVCARPYTAGTIYAGTLETGNTAQFTGTAAVTCKSAGFEFEQLSPAHTSVVGEMEPVTFGNCNGTVTAVNLPWEVNIVDISGGKGTWEATLSGLGAGEPGVQIGSCTYTATAMEFEFFDTLVTGGNARMTGVIPLSGKCGGETLTVKYRVIPPAGTIYPG
ncbi:MAG: hypothetical protein AB7V58_18365 [Solirubrobacterales bacterium]